MSVSVYVENLETREGEWVDLPCDTDEVLLRILGEEEEEVMELDEEGEEVGTGEFEGNGEVMSGHYIITEVTCDNDPCACIPAFFKGVTDLDTANEMAEFLDGLSSHDEDAFMAICEAGYGDWDSNVTTFNNGDYSFYKEKSWSDLGYQVYDELYGVKNIGQLENYIDWEAYGRDLGYTETSYGFIEIF